MMLATKTRTTKRKYMHHSSEGKNEYVSSDHVTSLIKHHNLRNLSFDFGYKWQGWQRKQWWNLTNGNSCTQCPELSVGQPRPKKHKAQFDFKKRIFHERNASPWYFKDFEDPIERRNTTS